MGKCHKSPTEALNQCFAIGSACGQACGFFSPNSPLCIKGRLDPHLFTGLTTRRVKIKTVGGGGAAEALVQCHACKGVGYHFDNMYVEAENPLEFLKEQRREENKEKGSFNVVVFAITDFHPPTHTFSIKISKREGHRVHHIYHHGHKDTTHHHHNVEKQPEKPHKDEKDKQ